MSKARIQELHERIGRSIVREAKLIDLDAPMAVILNERELRIRAINRCYRLEFPVKAKRDAK